MAMASHGQSGALPKSSIQPVKKPALRPKVRSTYSMMPPEMGIAAVSSPKHMPMGTRNTAPMANAIMAGTGPPPSTIQSPTSSTQPVPMMAPKPMVKKLKSVSSFFKPPAPGRTPPRDATAETEALEPRRDAPSRSSTFTAASHDEGTRLGCLGSPSPRAHAT